MSKKKVSQKEKVSGKKNVVHKEEPQSYYNIPPIWSFKRMDTTYRKWCVKHASNLYVEIIEHLLAYEGMTWAEIIKASGGRKEGNNNHFEDISNLNPEAQKRWEELKLDEYDSVFSLRLGGKKRLYGLIDNGIFSIIWYCNDHEIYPMKKK